MDSREILPETESVLFLLDTESLDSRLSTDSVLRRFLPYRDYGDFTFIRTPEDSDSKILADIQPYQEEDTDGNRKVLKWDSNGQSIHTVRHLPSLYEGKAEDTEWRGPGITEQDLEFIDLFNSLISKRGKQAQILLTSNPGLLQNRRKLEHEFRQYEQGRMNIMSPSEAAEFAGIFMRRNNDFILYLPGKSATHKMDLSSWYWSLTRVFIHHFHATEYVSSMLDRFDSLWVSIDKLGEQYYSGTGNHTDLMTRYHFNNGISLLTGICDVLALHTREKYDLSIQDINTNLRTGNDVIKELKHHNEEAREYIIHNHEVIELLHTVRNDIIHQSGIIKRGPGLVLGGDETIDWQFQAISLGMLEESDREDFRKYYERLDDPVKEYQPLTEWGLIVSGDEPPEVNEYTHIEPYCFLKQATKEIAEFADEYLRILDHPNRLESESDSGAISDDTVKRVVDHGLFPLLQSRI